jgi:hypothetical protein
MDSVVNRHYTFGPPRWGFRESQSVSHLHTRTDLDNLRTQITPSINSLTPDMLARTYTAMNINLLKPTGHVMHQQFNIQQLYVLPALYLCVLYLSESKQRLVPLTA